jgi:hypothetical protein
VVVCCVCGGGVEKPKLASESSLSLNAEPLSVAMRIRSMTTHTPKAQFLVSRECTKDNIDSQALSVLRMLHFVEASTIKRGLLARLDSIDKVFHIPLCH